MTRISSMVFAALDIVRLPGIPAAMFTNWFSIRREGRLRTWSQLQVQVTQQAKTILSKG